MELFNGFKTFRRDLKSGHTVVHRPRLNICMLAQPNSFIKLMKEEQAVRDDALMHRFLSLCPSPIFSSAAEIKEAQKKEKPFPLECLLFALYLLHYEEDGVIVTYEFTADALVIYETIYTDFRKISQTMNEHDVFIR